MKTHAKSGYVVEWNVLKKVLPIDFAELIDDIMDKEDEFAANQELTGYDLGDTPRFELFTPNFECNLHDMQEGVTYAIFDIRDLYVLTPKPELRILNAAGIRPEFERWTTWG